MKCPVCNAWTRVIKTTSNVRRRECGNLHRFTTRELPEIIDRDTQEMKEAIARHAGTNEHVASLYGISAETVRRWRKQLQTQPTTGPATGQKGKQ